MRDCGQYVCEGCEKCVYCGFCCFQASKFTFYMYNNCAESWEQILHSGPKYEI